MNIKKISPQQKEAEYRRLKTAQEYAHMTPYDQYPTRVQTNKNIKADLKKYFPDVNFSVKGTDGAVTIRWTDGPTYAMVHHLVQKFKFGHFDGSIDLYEYSNELFTDIYGGHQFVFCERYFSDEFIERAIQKLTEKYSQLKELHITAIGFQCAHYWNVIFKEKNKSVHVLISEILEEEDEVMRNE